MISRPFTLFSYLKVHLRWGKVSLSGYTIYLRLLAMKELNAIRPGLNCFISMIISVVSRCGFQPCRSVPAATCFNAYSLLH